MRLNSLLIETMIVAWSDQVYRTISYIPLGHNKIYAISAQVVDVRGKNCRPTLCFCQLINFSNTVLADRTSPFRAVSGGRREVLKTTSNRLNAYTRTFSSENRSTERSRVTRQIEKKSQIQ